MKIFISWSGPKSRRVAEELRDWLPSIFANSVKPWISTRDIKPGQRGIQEISEQLKDARFGVVCLTAGNIEAPWIHFEAGAISKAVEPAYVCTYLVDLDVSDMGGENPLAQFQAVKADRDGTWRIVESINGLVSAHASDKLPRVFDKWWPEFKNAISDLPQEEGAPDPQRPEREILEELVSLTRNQGGIVRDVLSRLQEVQENVQWVRVQGPQRTIPQSSLYYGPGSLLAALNEAVGSQDVEALAEIDKAIKVASERLASKGD